MKIIDKLTIILLVNFILSGSKFLFFGINTYLKLIIFQDFLLLILLILPRFFTNIGEFKINFIKDFNASKQGTLVLGGLGYIGSGLVLDLLKDNQKVSVLDCAMYGNSVLRKFYAYPNFNFIKGYASDVVKLGKLLKEN